MDRLASGVLSLEGPRGKSVLGTNTGPIGAKVPQGPSQHVGGMVTGLAGGNSAPGLLGSTAPHHNSNMTGTTTQQSQANIIMDLRRQLREQYEQIEALKRQNSRLSVLVDTAVVKLESLGYSLIPPFDIESELLAATQERTALHTDNRSSNLGLGMSEDGQQGALECNHHLHPVPQASMVPSTALSGGAVGGKGSSGHSRKFRMQHELKEHRGAVTCGQFSPDGQHFCAGSHDGTCSVWRVRSERIRQPSAMLRGSDVMISDICWFPSSDRVVASGFDGLARTFAVETGSVLHSFEPNEGALMLATTTTSHHSLYLCSDSRKGMHLVDIRAKNGAVETWKGDANPSALTVDTFSQAGASNREWIRVLSGDTNGQITLWDLRMVASGGGSGTVHRTPTRRSEEGPTFPATHPATATAAGAAPASANDARYTREINSQWYDAEGTLGGPSIAGSGTAGMESSMIADQRDPLTTATAAAGGVGGSAGLEGNSSVRFPISHISLHRHSGDDSERLLVVSEEGTLRLYQRQANYGSDPLRHEKTSATAGGMINTRSLGSSSHNFDLRTLAAGVPTRSNPIRGGYRPGNTQTRRVMVDDDEDSYASAGARAIRDSDLLVVGGTDNNVSVFDVSAMTRGGGGSGVDGASRDAEEEAARGGRTEGSQRQEAALIQRLEGHKDTVYGAVFHPDEPIIASYSADSTIRIWVPQHNKY